jgi:hypothetical protein
MYDMLCCTSHWLENCAVIKYCVQLTLILLLIRIIIKIFKVKIGSNIYNTLIIINNNPLNFVYEKLSDNEHF